MSDAESLIPLTEPQGRILDAVVNKKRILFFPPITRRWLVEKKLITVELTMGKIVRLDATDLGRRVAELDEAYRKIKKRERELADATGQEGAA